MFEEVPSFVDYHCHLDLYPDYEKQFRACDAKRIATLAVTTTPRAWPRNKVLTGTTSLVRVGLGFHPQLVGDHVEDLRLFAKYLPEARFVGEVGLDAGPAHYKTFADQKRTFETILKLCAQAGGKILSVHSVRSAREVISMIETHLTGTDNRVVLHWFTGSVAEARRAAGWGCYFSINQAMLGKTSTIMLIKGLPKERLLTETDGPFTKIGTRPTIPSDVAETTNLLATILQESPQETRKLLISNLTQLEKRTQCAGV